MFRFTRGVITGEPIEVYNHGRMVRDFTYIDDITEGVVFEAPSRVGESGARARRLAGARV